jgi:GNAT superfamily N-acetyltransferase
MAGFSIELATSKDCVDCARLLVEQLREHDIPVSAEPLQHVLKAMTENSSHGFVLLARDKAQIVGVSFVAMLLSAEHCGLAAWLEELYVTPEYRGRGVGTALLEEVFQRARNAGVVAIELEVVAGHERVVSLYERFGFRPLQRARWVRHLEK